MLLLLLPLLSLLLQSVPASRRACFATGKLAVSSLMAGACWVCRRTEIHESFEVPYAEGEDGTPVPDINFLTVKAEQSAPRSRYNHARASLPSGIAPCKTGAILPPRAIKVQVSSRTAGASAIRLCRADHPSSVAAQCGRSSQTTRCWAGTRPATAPRRKPTWRSRNRCALHSAAGSSGTAVANGRAIGRALPER